jgi:hypothetical protein
MVAHTGFLIFGRAMLSEIETLSIPDNDPESQADFDDEWQSE